MNLFIPSLFKPLFEEYFFNQKSAFIFILFGIITFFLFLTTNSIHSTRETTKQKKRLKQLTLAFCFLTLVVLFVFCRQSGIRGIRLWDYWMDGGTAHDKIETSPPGFLVDLLIFIPVGYLIRWQRHTTHWQRMILTVTAIAFSVELLQFATMHGCFGLSDLLAYHIGGMIGIHLCRRNAHGRSGRPLSITDFLSREFEDVKDQILNQRNILRFATSVLLSAVVLRVVHSYRGLDSFDLLVYCAGAISGVLLTRSYRSRSSSRSRDRKQKKNSDE